MLSEEVLRKVKLIELSTRRVVDTLVGGAYRTHFKGHGVQFREHQVYVPGDDVRHIDWKVSARSRDTLVKRFEEERELSVFLVVDVSASKRFGSHAVTKSTAAAEIGGMLAYAATHTGDRVGALFFADGVEKIIPPKKGRNHVSRLIKEILTFDPRTKGTDLAGALEAAGRIMKHSGIIIVLSDFWAEGYDVVLRRLGRKHDVLLLDIKDPRESVVPGSGWISLASAEGAAGEETWVDTDSYAFRQWFEKTLADHDARLRDSVRGSKSEWLRLQTTEDYLDAVVSFLRRRR